MNADIHSAATAIASSSTAFPFQLPMAEIASVFPSSPSTFDSIKRRRQNPRKKRSRIDTAAVTGSSGGVSKPKYSKNPDPRSPKITPPCTECGKKFWSDKALFGHMRCHPERQWRGINPPINFLPRPISVSPNRSPIAAITEEEHDIADCLIMLANSPNFATDNKIPELDDAGTTSRFECSSCKKVFGSHQALGGHRASHKNVKGCFAIARGDEEETEEHQFQNAALFGHEIRNSNLEDKMSMFLGIGHKCSICMRVFASGQALGGHMRCHWERVEENSATEGCANLDLNLPPAPAEDDSSSSYSSVLTLDLRLGL